MRETRLGYALTKRSVGTGRYRHVVFWAVERNDEIVTKERVERIRRLRIKDCKEPKKSKLNVDSVESVSKAIIAWKLDAEPDFFWRLDSIKEG